MGYAYGFLELIFENNTHYWQVSQKQSLSFISQYSNEKKVFVKQEHELRCISIMSVLSQLDKCLKFKSIREGGGGGGGEIKVTVHYT